MDGAEDEGNLCEGCAVKREEEIKKNPKKYGIDPDEYDDIEDAISIGGGYCYESSGPCFCEMCNTVLMYILTDEGAEQELDHVLEGTTKISSGDKYELFKLFEKYYPNLRYDLPKVNNHRLEKLAEKIIEGAEGF